jgi:hypothetical protein
MKAYLNRLKQKWDIRSDRQLLVVFIVFGITGSGSVKLADPILNFTGITEIKDWWIRVPLRLLMIFPVYQALLLLVGGVFGQFRFFLNLQKRWFRLKKKSSAKDF